MDLSNVSKAQKMQLPIYDKTVTTDLAGDFSLPDYQPEIKRLLRIRAAVMPPTGYCTADSIDMSGIINYFVLYVGGDNSLYCAPLSTEYSVVTPIDANSFDIDTESIFATCESKVESSVGRVSAPRRLSIKTKLNSRVKAYADSMPRVDVDGDDKLLDTLERLEGKADVCRLAYAQSQPVMLTDDIILEQKNQDMRVVCAEGQVFVSDVRAADRGAECRGELILKLTLSPEPTEGDSDIAAIPPVILWRKLPFTEIVELDGAGADISPAARGYCTDLSVEIEEGQLHVECAATLEVFAQKNECISYVKDIYSTRQDSTERYATRNVQCAHKTVNSNFTLSDSLLLSEAGIDGGAQIADVCGTAAAEEISCDGDRCVVSGKAHFHLLLCSNGEYSFAELDLPFRYEVDCNAAERVVLCESEAGVISCRARMDGERIGIDAEIAMMLRIASEDNIKMLEGVEFKREVVRRRGEYVVCFPAPDDTLWSVAKRYHAPMATLSVANDLPSTAPDDANALNGIGYLIV
ncbi:MAG: hypothetical protein E7589_07895 [Ruminococcaceae bacterium]|nr:hypothetical protein [Oscillospiraceae bacterium]